MRDPERISKALNLIGQYWMKYPDLRLGQLISNMNAMYRNSNGLSPHNDVHCLEDSDLINELEKALNDKPNSSKNC